MKVIVTFDTSELFTAETQDAVNAYFRREIRAQEAAKQIRFSREQWERHLSAIFAEGNSEIRVEQS